MCSASDAIAKLDQDEVNSLLLLSRRGGDGIVPFPHAEKFIGLGLAELNCGSQMLTATGRRAIRLLS
ncbi:MAG: hypothetical protein ACFBSD_15720 [Paracoccaceae bacterium]